MRHSDEEIRHMALHRLSRHGGQIADTQVTELDPSDELFGHFDAYDPSRFRVPVLYWEIPREKFHGLLTTRTILINQAGKKTTLLWSAVLRTHTFCAKATGEEVRPWLKTKDPRVVKVSKTKADRVLMETSDELIEVPVDPGSRYCALDELISFLIRIPKPD